MSATDRYRQFFRRSPALLVALDRDGYFLDATDAWLERFGYGRDEIDGLRPQDLASEASLRRIVEDYLPLLRRAGQLSRVPVDLLTKTGGARRLPSERCDRTQRRWGPRWDPGRLR